MSSEGSAVPAEGGMSSPVGVDMLPLHPCEVHGKESLLIAIGPMWVLA